MGQRGTVNCLLNFSENGDSVGTLIGEPGKGMAYMFHMMNEARLGVGYSAAMCGLGGYLYSLGYARERLQGRHPENKDPSSPQIRIIEHADVKRMLLAQKAAVEGAAALCGYCAYLVDLQKVASEDGARAEAGSLLDLLTPVAKSWPSEHCLEANKHAIQILGGYGYTRDYPVERFYRDNRLNPIHEGSFGIQGLDLLGRKVRLDGGTALDLLSTRIAETIDRACTCPELAEAHQLRAALDALRMATTAAVSCNHANLGLANATLYLDAFGHVVIAWLWLWQGLAASKALAAGASSADESFYRGKLATCRYFFRYELPKVHAVFALVGSLDNTCSSFDPDDFTTG
jgi:butyryl-CoA dehydrogenase